LNLTQWVHIQDNLLFSHAGITDKFWEYLNLGEPTEDNILKINEIEPSSLFGFTPNRFSDYYGDSETQPLTWVRPITLMQYHIKDWVQVVGHTRVKKPGSIDDFFEGARPDWCTIPGLWILDCLPYKYMVIEGEEKQMKIFC
jgi:hypothetical protein